MQSAPSGVSALLRPPRRGKDNKMSPPNPAHIEEASGLSARRAALEVI